MSEHADSFDPKEFIANLPRRPGVYRMYSRRRGELLYVGKARSLRDRVGNYFLASNVDPKVQALVGHIARIEVTLTNSETEALLLEYNLIKEHKPRYNIVLRDDKSFPVHLSTVGPRIPAAGVLSRRAQPAGPLLRAVPERRRGQGNAAERAEDLPHPELPRHLLREPQPALPAAPDRPLLGALREAHLARGLRARHRRGREGARRPQRRGVRASSARAMEQAAANLQYERAAALRDQLAALKQVQAQQIVTAEGDRDIDVFALVGEPGEFAVSVMIIRGGRNLGLDQLLPEGRAGRAQRSAGLVPHAVLRRDAAAARRSSSISSSPKPKR